LKSFELWPSPVSLYNGQEPLMTKVQIRFRLQKDLDEVLLSRISDAYAIYGIQKIQVAPSGDKLTVEYDATRLRPAEVESAFENAGIPVEPIAG